MASRQDLLPLPPRLSGLHSLPLVGREAERRMLEEAWTVAETGQRQAVFIGGEPGVGKTRLAGDLALACHSQGAIVLAGASVWDPGTPHRPFTEALEHLLHHEPGWSLVPEGRGLVSQLKGKQPAERGTRALSRRELYDAVSSVLGEVARRHPLILLLDDLHWATPNTLRLLAHVIERSHDTPMLVLVTFRTTLPDRSSQLTAQLAELHRLEGIRRLDLSGLDAEAIAEYLQIHGDVPATEARASATVLRDMTGGNPFFVREIWYDASRRGGLHAVTGSEVPASIRDTLNTRLGRLGDRPRRVLEMAAVAGEQFDTSTLLGEIPEDPGRVLAAIDAATVANLIQPVQHGPGDYAFVHSLTRQAVLDGLPSNRRMELHAAVARALEANGPDVESIPALAEHYLAAQHLGHHKEAVHYAVEAGELAERGLAHEEAAAWFERASSVPADDPSERSTLLLRAAANHLRAGGFAKARNIYEGLIAAEDAATRLDAAMGYEAASWRPGLAEPLAAQYLTRALDGVQGEPVKAPYVLALASLGRALAFTGAIDQARQVGDRALSAARRLGDPAILTHALETALWHGLGPELLPSQLRRSQELIELARSAHDPERLAVATHFRAIAEYMRGEAEGLEAAATELAQAARTGGQPFFEYVSECVAQGRSFLHGDFEGARIRIEAAGQIGTKFGPDTTEGSYGVQMYLLQRETGALRRLVSGLRGDEAFHGRWVAGLLALYTELEVESGARRALHHLLHRDLEKLAVEAQWPIELVFMTEGALFLHDRGAVERLLPHLRRYEGLNLIGGQFVALFGAADRYLARVAALRGAEDEAREYFRRAWALDHRTGSVVHSAETLAYHARFERQHGNDEAARRLAGEARELASPVGHRRALRLLPAPTQLDVPGGLTPREVEVLGLLARGLSNRAIADRLYISTNTAANHVRSIFTKTGTHNRTQAAVYARERGLA